MSTSRGGAGGAIVNVSSAAATLGSPHEYVHHAGAGDPDRADRAAERVPLGRAGQPGDTASATVWLLSAEASYMTATTLRVAASRSPGPVLGARDRRASPTEPSRDDLTR